MAIDASVRLRWIQAAVIAGMVVLGVVLLLPAVQQAREAARRVQSRNNLKQIGMAMHAYHDSNQRFPSGGTFDANGKGYHGWPASIWCYLEAIPSSAMADFQQPWDAADNAGRFERPLWCFYNPSIVDPSTSTHVKTSTTQREFAVTHYSVNSNLLAPNSAVRLSEIEDQGNTFLAGELGGDFTPWGCPYNWRPLIGLTETPRTYGRRENIGGHFLMVDGSVRWIAPDISKDVLSSLRGRDIAGISGHPLPIIRPNSFPFPADARDPWTLE